MLSAAAERTLLIERRLSGLTAGCSGHSSAGAHPFGAGLPTWFGIGPQKGQKRQGRLTKDIKALASAAWGERMRIVTRESSSAKRILAEIQVQATVPQLWSVLTNYSQLANFVPNLEHCERLAGAPPGKQRILQRACSQSIFCRLQAEAILDVEERILPLGRRELLFTMVTGDFKELSGKWILEPDPTVRDGRSLATILKYEVNILPHWSLPSTLVAAVIRCGLPANVQAIAKRAEQMAETRRTAPKFAKAAFQESTVSIPLPSSPVAALLEDALLPAKGPPRSLPAWLSKAVQSASDMTQAFGGGKGVAYLGLKSVPIPPSSGMQNSSGSSWQEVQAALPTDAKDLGQRSDMRRMDEMRWIESENAVMEVHLRRLDDSTSLKRRAVASIQIDARKEEVWESLTDYERLPDFLPGLAGCERLPPVAGAPERLVRLRQVGFKNMMYMHLHAETTLALVESPCTEIQFKQISGDFQMLQGKFMLNSEPVPGMQTWNKDEVTELRYAVEVEIPRSTRMVGLLEPLLEQVVYQDIPTNLRAIKLHIEQTKAQEKAAASKSEQSLGRPTSSQMCADFILLAEELEKVFADQAALPTRKVLREMKRYDLEMAIAHHGGMRVVSKRLGKAPQAADVEGRDAGEPYSLLLAEEEFKKFGQVEGLPPYTLPPLDLLARRKRTDLTRMANSWGGIQGLSDLLGYSVAENVTALDIGSDLDTDDLMSNTSGSKKPPRRKLLASFQVLAEELRATLGEEGPLPTSTQLRNMRRFDLDAAISHHGGANVVSERMGWQKAFRGPNYWSDLKACKQAVDEFCEGNGLAPGVLPSLYSMQQAGRHDLHRAVRHWGGAPKFAAALGYEYKAGSGSAKPKERKEGQKSQDRPPKVQQKKLLREEIDSW